jgi:tetratricopeptide (TPR) repeat protein
MRLRGRRRDRGLTLAQLSFPGCTTSFLSRIEQGERVPAAPVLTQLAKRLGVSPEQLAGRGPDGAIAGGRIAVAEMAMRMGEAGAQQQLEALLAEARSAGDGHAESRALEGLAAIAAEAGRDEQAATLLERARTCDPAATPRTRPGLYEELGKAYAAQGDLVQACLVLEAALADAREAPADPSAVARFGLFLASALTDRGDFAAAERTLTEVLAVEPDLADPVSRARVAWTLARTYAEEGRSHLAERYARRALAEYEASEESYRLGRAHLFLSQLLIDQARPEEAAGHLESAARLMHTGGPTTELAALDLERARAALLASDLAGATAAATRALDGTAATEPPLAGRAYLVLAGVAFEQGRLDDARFLCGQALAVLDGTAAPHHGGDVLRLLAQVEQRAGNLAAALDALWQASGAPTALPADPSGYSRRTVLPE